MSSMPKYIKLGEKAYFFYDPVTKLKVMPNKVYKIDMSKVPVKGKIKDALKGGHLEYAEKSEYVAPEGEVEVDEEEEAAVTKADLIVQAIEAGSELSKTKLKKLTVEEIQEHIESLD